MVFNYLLTFLSVSNFVCLPFIINLFVCLTQVVAFEVMMKVECGTQTTEIDTSLMNQAEISTSKKRKLTLNQYKKTKKNKVKELDNRSHKQQKDDFFKLCDKFLSDEFSELVKAQTKKDSKARKQHLSITTEINEKVISILKLKVDNMTNSEKICSVIVDAIELRPHMVYNTSEDRFIGFHEVDGIQTGDPATMALVLILRGIVFNWQQPVGFALLSEYRDYDGVSKWVDKLIDKLCEIGLDVKAIVSNMEPDMYNLAKQRLIAPEKPFFTLLKVKKIFHIFDASNLLMMVRDSLLENEFNFQGCVASLEPIKHFYTNDREKSVRLAPKLTQNHIDPNIVEQKDVRLAAQLLSNSVAAAILTYIDFYVIDESGRDTVKVIKLMNDLFDLLNSTKLEDENVYKTAFNGNPRQLKLFNEAINFIRTLKLVDPKTGRDVTQSAKFIEGFQITIGAIMLLLEDLSKKGISYLRTKRLSTDATAKMFAQIRSRCETVSNPTCRQFVSVFRDLFIKDLMKPPAGKDCSTEIIKLLAINGSSEDLDEETDEQNDTSIDESENNVKVKSSEYNQIEIPDKNTVVYLSSYLLKRCAEKHKGCKILNSYIAPAPEQRIHNFGADIRYQKYREYCKETCSSLLVVPYDDFIIYVEMMEEEFRCCIKKKRVEKDIAASMYKEISQLNFSPPCPCFPIIYLKKLFIRMRIFHTVQYNNKKWRTTLSKRKYFTVPNL